MAETIKVFLLGTPEIAVPTLENLATDSRFKILGVITQPDRPAGRKQILTPSPVKVSAQKLNIPVYQPEKLNKDPQLIEQLRNLEPDFLLVFAYGQILSQEILDLPKIKAINVHGSLLPKYRGASPIEEALLNGDHQTGISYMEMVKAMDAGAVYQTNTIPINLDDTAETLRKALGALTATTVAETLIKIKNNELKSSPQDESLATNCHKITKEDSLVNFQTETAEAIFNKLRAFQPWPGIYFVFKNRQFKIHRLERLTSQKLKPGQFSVQNNRLEVGTTTNDLNLLVLQPEGKQSQNIEPFLNGNRQLFLNSYISKIPGDNK